MTEFWLQKIESSSKQKTEIAIIIYMKIDQTVQNMTINAFQLHKQIWFNQLIYQIITLQSHVYLVCIIQ